MDRLWQKGWYGIKRSLRAVVIGGLILICLGLGVACSGSDDSSSIGVIPPAPGTPPPTTEPGTVVVPMPVRQVGSLRLLGLPTTVAGGSAELLLDTGSGGVRILAAAAGSQGLQVTDTDVPPVFFADGTVFEGVLATAPVSLGSASTAGPITVQLITEVRCQGGGDDCSRDLFDGTGFFSGIIGTSLLGRSNSPDLFSPVPQLSGNLSTGYLIRTGGFNSSQGTFTLGLTDNNTNGAGLGFLDQIGTFPNGAPIWDDELPVSYTIQDSTGVTVINQQVSETVFDTGSSDIFLDTNVLGSSIFLTSQLVPGSRLTTVLQGGFTYGFTVTVPVTPGDDRVFVDSFNGFQILGMPFFFDFDVFFDIEQGRIGFLVP